MRKLLLRALFVLIPFLYSIYGSSQPKNERDCSTTCFSTEMLSVQKLSGMCTSYEMKVSYSGSCAHALSHFSVAVPCGYIQQVWNSENWAQAIGTDPTTGLSGFKIDDIADFGKSSMQYFTVKFTICSTDENCTGQLSCWQPQVAYKASTCVNYETVNISCKSLKASLEKQDVSCYGGSDGSLSVSISEGTGPYTYLWSNNSTSESQTGLSAGTFSVVIRDASGEQITLEEVIGQPEAIVISGVTSPASCNGTSDGSIDLDVSGGAGNYTFTWDNGQVTEDLQSLASGQYMVIVNDEKDCSATARFSIGSSSRINITATQLKPDCSGSNGALDLTVAGGTFPYTFAWSNGATSEDLSNISAGLYSVTVSDAAGCSEKASFLLKDNNTLLLKATVTPTSCMDDASGAINLTVSGGTAPYTFDWSNGETTKDLSNLNYGFYSVVVKDSKGCSVSSSFTVSKNTFQISRTVIQPTCHDDNNGSIILQEPIGGTGPFTYEWSNGNTGTGIHDLTPGIYTVTVTDATGCSRTLTSVINNPSEIIASASVANVECNAEGFFSLDLSVSGGTAPYTFEWSNGSTAEDLERLQSGTYTVNITDAHGCTISKEVVVEGPESAWSCLIIDLETMPECNTQNNMLSTSVTDADSYSWSIESTDGSWSISAAQTPSIAFSAGGENSSATVTLIIVKDGCTRTCTYAMTSCSSPDHGEEEEPGNEEPGGEEPGGEGPGEETPGEEPNDGEGGNQTCEECFNTIAKVIESSGGCRTYEMEVNTNGLCSHDLSHWTVAIPCGSIRDYSNSEGWKMEYGKDPTAGLYGLKVDDISEFGKTVDTFKVRFTVCGNSDCELSDWNPTVAYKAGQCVGFETVPTSQGSSAMGVVSVYPNPFNEAIHFEWNAAQPNVKLDIVDQYGNTIFSSTKPTGKKDAYYITLESSALPKGMYYYRLTLDGKTFNGKISKR